jgi:hypothetical protein
MNPFRQRSSIPSNILTGLIGWIGFIFIGPMVFGFKIPSEILIMIAVASALAQVAFLRIAFFLLQMHRSILIGAFWGFLSAAGIFYLTTTFFYPPLLEQKLYWLIIYAYIGAPVGAFLSYFFLDDKKIFDASGATKADTSFGRDAHWLEPFGFGALGYLIAFFPFGDFDLNVNVMIVGAVSGVFAAGASHFSPDKWKQSWIILFLIISGVGCFQGLLTALLLRAYSGQLYTSHFIHGMAGGVITYLLTFTRGRQLANKEAKGEL